MEKQKRWQLAIILMVFALTVYNILPTVIYYFKPLKEAVTEKRAEAVQQDIALRVNDLENDARQWVGSFCDLLQITPKAIRQQSHDPAVIEVEFSTSREAAKFRKFLPQAGLEIPFVPAQLGLFDHSDTTTTVQVARRIGVRVDQKDTAQLFRFAEKVDTNGKITPFYFQLVADRFEEVLLAMNGTASQTREVEEVLENRSQKASAIFDLAKKLLGITDAFGETSPITKRFLKTFLSHDRESKSAVAHQLINKFEEEKRKIDLNKAEIVADQQKKTAKNELIGSDQIEALEQYTNEIKILDRSLQIMRKNMQLLQSQEKAISKQEVVTFLSEQYAKAPAVDGVYTFVIGDSHPLFQQLILDWKNDCLFMRLHPDVAVLRDQVATQETTYLQQEILNRWIINEVARIAQTTNELITAEAVDYRVNLYQLPSSTSLLALDLAELADRYAKLTFAQIQSSWKPSYTEFAIEQFPHFTNASYKAAGTRQKKLCLAVLAPSANNVIIPGLRQGSIYVVMRGLQSIMDQYERVPDSEEAKIFKEDFDHLSELLQKRGFIGYAGQALGSSPELRNDYIFELNDYYSMFLKATREDFYVRGSRRYATLEFSDVEQRILTQNRIDDAIQEDLLRWKEAYQAAQVSIYPLAHFTVPKPTQNAYFANFNLAFKKYFHGDDSKILRWGLDLSGGKSVRIALVDQLGHQVSDPLELRQAVNELYTRINKMGVAERVIRIENDTILLDFPGSQGLSAAELVKASAMYFHVVNEQFGPSNKAVNREVQEFLQEVWNEAVVTNRQDTESINEIAYAKLSMAGKYERTVGPKSPAQLLYEKGLRFVDPSAANGRPSAAFNDAISLISRYRGDDMAEWHHQTHPLVIVFRNYALEGSSLEGIQTSYDPSKGNILLFNVKNSYANSGTGGAAKIGTTNPRDDFYAWTSQFSEESIVGTAREAYTQGRGYRMAVVLNGTIISAPSLNAPLRDHAMITGNFSQREVAKLATDLRAGSLSFTPKILSEQNVSPELGVEERQKGINAALIGVALVIVAMCSYYRFAGVVASIAVLVNVLIIWAVMQNLDAALTLPGIAGMVLTVGMAVDANVLVFERIREEFKLSGRIAQAIQAGYRKAFSAIFDSNITTILAALILLQFDCGPIKGFAMTLIIGITSSMFTALFMTRYFFAGWIRNPANKELKMAEWIHGNKNFNFLKMTRPAFLLSAALFLVGMTLFSMNWKSMVGMDFTGGYSLVVEVEGKNSSKLPEAVARALRNKGLTSQEFQIRELGRPDLLRIQLGIGLEERGHAFYGMARELPDGTPVSYEFQKNPRIAFIVDALAKEGLQIKPTQLEALGHNWTVMSGQFSDAMRNNAVVALVLSLVGVLFYIAMRFEWKYAVSSVLALVHDVGLTLAVMAIANRYGAPVQLNLETIGAIMTIIGYSLNDTIIVFDRIREDIRLSRKKSFAEIINHALNQTLSRTLMTSGTTLLVLLALDFFAGTSIFGFAFVMTVGVFLGTLSSLFIASPILLWLHDREEAKRHFVEMKA